MGDLTELSEIDTKGPDVLLKRVDEAAKHMPTTGEYETEGTGMLASTDLSRFSARM